MSDAYNNKPTRAHDSTARLEPFSLLAPPPLTLPPIQPAIPPAGPRGGAQGGQLLDTSNPRVRAVRSLANYRESEAPHIDCSKIREPPYLARGDVTCSLESMRCEVLPEIGLSHSTFAAPWRREFPGSTVQIADSRENDLDRMMN